MHAERLAELAQLCRLGRDRFHVASTVGGFRPTPGTESGVCEQAPLKADWPGGPWPANGPTAPLHQVTLMIACSAAGRLGELGALLDAREVLYLLPMHSRGVVEQCARLFRVFSQPFLPYQGRKPMPPVAIKMMFAAVHREMFEGVFSALSLAQLYLKADPSDQNRQVEVAHIEGELARMQRAFAPLYDTATTNLTSDLRRLEVGGVQHQSLTSLVEGIADWIWPDPRMRPSPIYKDFSRHAHGSLDADIQLWAIVDSPTGRDLTRSILPDFVDSNILVAAALFHRTFQRLVGFYGWDERPLNEYSDAIVAAFPTRFTYTTPFDS